MNKILNQISLSLILSIIGSLLMAQQPAFPEAEGFGAYSQVGRGGRVLYVTNLNDSDDLGVTRLNYVNNYLIPGVDSKNNGIAYSTGSPYNKSYFSGNYYNEKCPENQWSLVKFSSSWTASQIKAYKQTKPFETGPVKTDDAITASKLVLDSGGASLPKRDAVDTRIVEDVRNRSGRIIKSQEDVGGWPELKAEPAAIVTDKDGMPDNWEITKGLNPNDKKDGNNMADDGYTMLEKYLNGIK